MTTFEPSLPSDAESDVQTAQSETGSHRQGRSAADTAASADEREGAASAVDAAHAAKVGVSLRKRPRVEGEQEQ
ncbi:hypothetical protein A5722_30245 [Mycobacterium vulneris]|uniref:Uncharacterized protein n=1 Tax=Mycolicibacterium septicum DSM 44393 TaxID=1341646 RepID=A0A7X6MTY5_9MYCO|nr:MULTISPECIES: hypothetical protein [Mycolicibacterium]MBX8685943.1 hypothetical protein [Mycobacterium sp. 20091114027_K0903767]MCP3811234.1 hypothetical protein [Mycobacteriaceae bacterium Msp059]OCB47859.1 hypothetical protein A5721_07060 [Mycolicibacterium vulneris]NKZ14880.1 hypothetical protein [Mycolicibacterium septicum DSM 44393]OBK07156.1 hypothetical protein A5637_05345 [Mycolicibacterium fortuitum]